MVVITYDAPDLQQAFIDAGAITFPMISDVDTATMRALGILNEDYEPGEPAYGIPYPGAFVVTPQRQIVGKIFVESHRQRVDAENMLAYAQDLLE